MKLEDFIESLYRAGWDSINDAQYEGVVELHKRLFPVVAELEEEVRDHLETIDLYMKY